MSRYTFEFTRQPRAALRSPRWEPDCVEYQHSLPGPYRQRWPTTAERMAVRDLISVSYQPAEVAIILKCGVSVVRKILHE
jgi:hypothetical protein